MPLVLNTNVSSLETQQYLNTSQNELSTATQRLASGLQINSAADDPAGYAIAQSDTARLNGTNQAIQNASDASSEIQVLEGGLQSITGLIQQVRSLAVEAAAGTQTTSQLSYLDVEAGQLLDEIDRTANTTIAGSFTLSVGITNSTSIQVGAYSDIGSNAGEGQYNAITLGTGSTIVSAISTSALGISYQGSSGISLSGSSASAAQSSAENAISLLDAALTTVNSVAATLGSVQDRLQTIVASLQTTSTNLAAARATIEDTNYAAETAAETQANVLQQAGVAVLAQANTQPQQILTLLQHL